MKRAAVYSSSRVRPPVAGEVPEVPRENTVSWRERLQPHRRRLRLAGLAAAALLLIVTAWTLLPDLRGMSQADVEAAIQRAMEANPPKPTAADAYEKILPSLVHVRALLTEEDPPQEAPKDVKPEAGAEPV